MRVMWVLEEQFVEEYFELDQFADQFGADLSSGVALPETEAKCLLLLHLTLLQGNVLDIDKKDLYQTNGNIEQGNNLK